MSALIENFTGLALQYLGMGFSVIPVGQNKVPLVSWEEYQTRKPTEEEIRGWASGFDNPNIGIVTGAISGLVVVDIEAGGSLDNLPETLTSKTGGGGYHYFYKHPGFPVKNAVRVREKTDIRGDGGYVVAPNSLHSSGNRYEWVNPVDKFQLAEPPRWVLSVEEKDGRPRVDWGRFVAQENEPGTRNMTATQLAGKLLHELPPDLWEIGRLGFCEWNIEKNNPPLNEGELRDVWQSIMNREKIKRGSSAPIQTRQAIDFGTLEGVINKWLLIKDQGIIKLLVATVLANKMDADPVWLFIVTASGGTKTELIRGLNKIDKIYPLSDLTPQSFLSGEKSTKNASLLHRLQYGTILTLKDFTTVLTMHRDKRHAILSQLREIYDGQFKKEFGTGETKEWNGKLGFIAGVTSIIDTHYSIYQTLGERFIQYRPTQPDPIELSLKAIGNSGYESEMREEIQDAFADFISGIKIPQEHFAIPEELKNRIAHLSAFCVRARSGVIRDGFSSREIELIPEAELPTRLSKQLITLICSLFLISGAFTNEDYELIYKVGMDTLPRNRRQVIETLSSAVNYMETTEIAMRIGYPTTTTRRILEDLCGLKLIDRESQGKGYADKWKMNGETRKLLEIASPDKAKEIFGVTELPTQQDLQI